jgi:hypothetical protein
VALGPLALWPWLWILEFTCYTTVSFKTSGQRRYAQ